MDNWDYANDCPLRETLRKRLARERAIARFDGATTPPGARDSDWIARELGDVPHETITGWRSAAGTRTPWFSDCIPVESLGRDA